MYKKKKQLLVTLHNKNVLSVLFIYPHGSPEALFFIQGPKAEEATSVWRKRGSQSVRARVQFLRNPLRRVFLAHISLAKASHIANPDVHRTNKYNILTEGEVNH